MARRTRIYYNHAVYHISIRGNNRQKVIKADEDKESFLEANSGDTILITINKY